MLNHYAALKPYYNTRLSIWQVLYELIITDSLINSAIIRILIFIPF